MPHLFYPSDDFDPPFCNPIADKPFAIGQRREYLGRRVFTTRKGDPQPIDVWRAWCTAPTCSRSFKVTAFHGHDPEPAPAVCRYCIWLAKLAGRKAAEVEREQKRKAAEVEREGRHKAIEVEREQKRKMVASPHLVALRAARGLARNRYQQALATARLHVGRPTYQAKLAIVSDKWFVLATARARCNGVPFEPERAAREALDKREVAQQQALTAAQAQPWRAYEVERTTVALDAAREALGQAGLADGAERDRATAMASAELRQADLERAVAAAVDKERAASAAAIAERDRAIDAWKHAGALAKAQHAEAIAALERKLATNVQRADGLEQKLGLVRERATVAERRLANAAARERMVAETVAEFGRRLSILEHKAPGAEPTFLD
jgi:hypothetical protein